MDTVLTRVIPFSSQYENASIYYAGNNSEINSTDVSPFVATTTTLSKFKTWLDYADYVIMIIVLIFAFISNGISIHVFTVGLYFS